MKKYPRESFYNLKKLSKKKFKRQSELACSIMEDYVRLSDVFYATNRFINFDNPNKDNYFRPEDKFLGFKNLFILGMIRDEHQYIFEDYTLKKVHELRSTDLPIKEKAKILCAAWRQMAVRLGEEDS